MRAHLTMLTKGYGLATDPTKVADGKSRGQREADLPNYFYLRDAPNAQRIIGGLQRLRVQLDAEIPPRSLDKTMRLATWNIREFDSPAYGDRIDDAYYFIAEIISRFDLVAIQE